LKDLAERMFNDLADRTEKHFDNPIMLAATFMDPRYRSFKFITRFEPPAKKRKNFSLLCEEVEIEPEKEMTSRDIIISEFRLYLTLKGLITEHTCPLEFYKLNFLN